MIKEKQSKYHICMWTIRCWCVWWRLPQSVFTCPECCVAPLGRGTIQTFQNSFWKLVIPSLTETKKYHDWADLLRWSCNYEQHRSIEPSSVDHGSSCQSQSEWRKGRVWVHLRSNLLQERKGRKCFPSVSRLMTSDRPTDTSAHFCVTSPPLLLLLLYSQPVSCVRDEDQRSKSLFHCVRLNNREVLFHMNVWQQFKGHVHVCFSCWWWVLSGNRQKWLRRYLSSNTK